MSGRARLPPSRGARLGGSLAHLAVRYATVRRSRAVRVRIAFVGSAVRTIRVLETRPAQRTLRRSSYAIRVRTALSGNHPAQRSVPSGHVSISVLEEELGVVDQ